MTVYKYITETSRKKEYHFVLWIVFAITASFLYNKNVINGDIISKVQNMKGKRFGRTAMTKALKQLIHQQVYHL